MSDNDSILKDLTKLIPGYGSYVEQESRRNDDRLTRDFLVTRLSDCKDSLDKIGNDALSKGDLDAPAKVEKLRSEVDLAQQRLRAAVEGYAGWFSERKVDADLLKQVAELDSNLVSLVDQMDAMGKSLLKSDSLDLSEYSEAAERLNQRIDRRTEILKGGA